MLLQLEIKSSMVSMNAILVIFQISHNIGYGELCTGKESELINDPNETVEWGGFLNRGTDGIWRVQRTETGALDIRTINNPMYTEFPEPANPNYHAPIHSHSSSGRAELSKADRGGIIRDNAKYGVYTIQSTDNTYTNVGFFERKNEKIYFFNGGSTMKYRGNDINVRANELSE